VKLFPDTRSFGGLTAGVPDYFGVDGTIGAGMPAPTRKQPFGRLPVQPAIVLPEFLQQMRAEHHVPVLAALPAPNMDDHPLAIDVADLQMRQLGAPHPGGIQSNQDGAVKWDQR